MNKVKQRALLVRAPPASQARRGDHHNLTGGPAGHEMDAKVPPVMSNAPPESITWQTPFRQRRHHTPTSHSSEPLKATVPGPGTSSGRAYLSVGPPKTIKVTQN